MRQRMNLNFYDSVRLADICESRVKMFGNTNIGRLEYTNLQVPATLGLLPGDQYAVLHNWYARAAVASPTRRTLVEHEDDAWQEWVNATTVTLVLGCMPVHQLPLADLLRRREGQRDATGGAKADADLARLMHDEYSRVTVTELCKGRGEAPPPAFGAWDLALGDGGPDPAERKGWVAVAAMARSLLTTPALCVVPQRQSCYVTLDTNMKKLGRVLEAVSSDQLRVWVHLEGVACTDSDL